MHKINQYKLGIATFLAILFHVCGAIGILFTPYRDWFIANTPLNLLLMGVLLIWNQAKPGMVFGLFAVLCFMVGMGTEMIGVNTGKLFGCYQYGAVLGPQLNGVPWLIGLNWFVIVYTAGIIMHSIHIWIEQRYEEAGKPLSQRLISASLVVDGALLAVGFDWVMEPVAEQLGFWHWEGGQIPFYNYLCWFLISALLLGIFRVLRFEKANHFAVHLFVIQSLFFLTLRWYL